MDTFKITGYNKDTQVVTATFVLAPRAGYAGETLTAVKLSNPPTDSVASVQQFFRSHADAYIAGKMQEEAKKVDIALDVKALLNVVTNF
jgi:hypothetical protein